MWFNVIGLYGHVTGDVVELHFGAGTGKRLDHYLLAYWTAAILFPLPYSLSFLPCILFLLAWLKLMRILFPLPSDENNLRQIQICLSCKFYLQSQPTRSRFLTKGSYWLSLKPEGTLDHSTINTQCATIIFIRLLTNNYPTSPRRTSLLSSTFLSSISWK